MPDVAQDPSQDEDFLKAPPSQQHAYLMDSDPDYAKAPQGEQKAYLDHVNGTRYTETGGTTRPVAPLPANPIQAARPGGEEVHGGGGPSERPKREALVREAGSPLAVPLTIGARALESFANRRNQQNLSNAATGRAPQRPAPDEANIALPEGAGLPDTHQNVAPFLARSGADAMRAAAGALMPTSLGIMAAAPAAPVITGTGLLLHGGKTALENAPEAFKGNPDAAQRALNAAAEATGGATLAGGGVAEGAPDINALRRLGRTAIDSNMGLKTLGITKPEPEQAFTRAIQPGVNIPRAQESMPIAGARLQQVKNAGLVTDEEGNPITEFKSNKDILQGVKAAKEYVYNAIDKILGKTTGLQADTTAVGDAMSRAIPKRIATQYPDVANRIRERAETYNTHMSFRDIEAAIQSANNDLRNFYKQPIANDKPISADTAATEAEVKALRNLLDEKMESLTGSGVKSLKREYGALRDVERAAARQYAIETRQKGATLWEGLAALRAAGDFVSGNVLGAAKGAATMAMGRRLATVRSPEWLIDQAFQGPKAFRAAPEIAPPPGVSIKGLLPEGPKITPAPADRSGPVDLGKPTIHEGTRESRTGKNLLPPAPTAAGAAPDRSGPVNLGRPFTEAATRAIRKGLLLPEKTGPALDATERGPEGNGGPNQKPPAFEMPPSSAGKAPNLEAHAKQEVEALHSLWSDLPAPGRFVHNATEISGGATQDKPDTVAFGINSPKPAVEQQFPWLRDLPMMTLKRVREALTKGKGVDYDRVTRAALEYLRKNR